jgi:hypothetical protein
MLTATQLDHLALMPEADRRDWTNYYTDRNEREMAEAERAIVAAVKAGVADPVQVRRAVGVHHAIFNAAVRFLKFVGALGIDEAGLLYSCE